MPISRRQFLTRTATATAALPLLALPARAATHQVAIRGMAFVPAAITIAAGDSVTFVNEDQAPHTATCAAFDTGRLTQGQSASLTFSAPGQFAYACAIHGMMTGSITVA